MSSSDGEREVLPGVFLTDFRTPATIAANAASASAAGASSVDQNGSGARAGGAASQQQHEHESKAKENAEMEDDDNDLDEDSPIPADANPAAPSSSSASSSLARDHPSTFPLDIPNDVESLELELAALTKNLSQLLKSNDILQDELRLQPDDADFQEAVRENRVVILRRSDRMAEIRAQLQLLAPHRVEAINAQLAEQVAQQQAAAARDTAPPAGGEGIFL
jgi:hypothetical protein